MCHAVVFIAPLAMKVALLTFERSVVFPLPRSPSIKIVFVLTGRCTSDNNFCSKPTPHGKENGENMTEKGVRQRVGVRA